MTSTIGAKVGATVRAEMARRRITQARLAEEIGRSQTQVSKRLSGRVPFTVPELAAVADVLDVPLAELAAAVQR